MTETRNLASALAALQEQLPEIRKTERADVKTQKGSDYSYTYAGLAAVSHKIMPLMGGLGLSFIARPTFTGDGKFVLAYSLLHSSGEREDGEYPLPASGTPQAIGSAITYGRRYCLCAATGAAPEDDDDDAAAAQEEERQRARPVAARARRQQPAEPQAPQRQAARQPAGPPPLPGEDEPEESPAAGPRPVTPKQLGKLGALFSGLGFSQDDRTERIGTAAKIVGRRIGSSKELTLDEASALIDTLERCEGSQERLIALLAAGEAPGGQASDG